MEGSGDGSRPRVCGCTGIRSCLLCGASANGDGKSATTAPARSAQTQRRVFCTSCGRFFADSSEDFVARCDPCASAFKGNDPERPNFAIARNSAFLYPNHTAASSHLAPEDVSVMVISNFVSAEEEDQIVKSIDAQMWAVSQSGRRKQDYGPSVNFKKQKLKLGRFNGLPPFASLILSKLKKYEEQIQHARPKGDQQSCQTTEPTPPDPFESLQNSDCQGAHLPRGPRNAEQSIQPTVSADPDAAQVLRDFCPVELCNLEYDPERGSAIDPHLDDSWLWGERLVTLNLLSDTFLSLLPPSFPAPVPTSKQEEDKSKSDHQPSKSKTQATNVDGKEAMEKVPEEREEKKEGRNPMDEGDCEDSLTIEKEKGKGKGRSEKREAVQTANGAVGSIVAGVAASESDLAGAGTVLLPLPRRSLLILQGVARHFWLHGIEREHVRSRRIAVTLRELAPSWVPPAVSSSSCSVLPKEEGEGQGKGKEEGSMSSSMLQEWGERLLQVAMSMEGRPVNFPS
uniref:Fe2OG dioxygenase domain-containing protein n=1 Tax=Chromera velia CCMP2878 TaxID=1169474 RepID=A0A0G4GB93_9ALVE|mmetsp:Transcript_47179/g.93072  ORF Transcript_47179/g.93072 Transcript_47179/m.93072 type:complete len:512 (+) Transcript_47179:99-1634(+)|eukprot:Cvel_20983.t1-p1 / transcript=Cvel_20983.t1 / gene=Cvel_20983 / organism=Chromera_velia_CCMP2878 / gene_product=Alpha-ketoglutarate-dependent dioxygenase alkB, putative / transcript_product=Alpha-ketoglutarate-dependent dioxygenase alkB, putative / location=Cvel_scaffold1931:9719-11831(+) / protein_length=511 / sequence_SO=supercontig / SO=protein_coding / is_pseudo=false